MSLECDATFTPWWKIKERIIPIFSISLNHENNKYWSMPIQEIKTPTNCQFLSWHSRSSYIKDWRRYFPQVFLNRCYLIIRDYQSKRWAPQMISVVLFFLFLPSLYACLLIFSCSGRNSFNVKLWKLWDTYRKIINIFSLYTNYSNPFSDSMYFGTTFLVFHFSRFSWRKFINFTKQTRAYLWWDLRKRLL